MPVTIRRPAAGRALSGMDQRAGPGTGGGGFAGVSNAYRWHVVAVLLFVSLLSYADRSVLIVLVTSIKQDLGLSDTQMGVLLGPAFIILYVVASLPIGYLADRISRRNLLLAGVAVWSVGTFACGLADSFGWLFVARAFVGVGEAAVIPCSYSLIADYFPSNTRGRATAVVAAGMGLGSGAALYGGGVLVALGTSWRGIAWPIIGPLEPWQFVFAICGLTGIAAIALLATVAEPPRQDGAGTAEEGAPPRLLTFVRAHAVTVTLVLGAYVLGALILSAGSSWLPTILVRGQGMGVEESAYLSGLIVLAVMPVTTLVGGYVGDHLTRTRASGRFLIPVVIFPFFVPAVLLAHYGMATPLIVTGVAIFYLVGGAISTTVYAAIQDVVPNRLRGQMLALYQLLANVIGVSLAAPSVGFVTDHVLRDPDQLGLAFILVCGPVALLGFLFALLAMKGYARLRTDIN
ncbi:MAG: MFS transporter [Sphingobium sp.]